MKVSLNWLKDYVDIDMTAEELSRFLTMRGFEVDSIEAVGQGLEPIVVARILNVKPHPEADRLFLCDVDTGQGVYQVVCGAPNVKEDLLLPMALPGVKLPDGRMIEKEKIRGQVSFGMLLAEDELGLTDDHTGIMVLPSDIEPGTSLPGAYPVEDWVIEFEITPNRPDGACVMGIAREIAAGTGQALRMPSIAFREEGPAIDELTSVKIQDPLGCPRYTAGMIQNVTSRPSPFWMRVRLHLAGVRSINSLVDVTNFVMLEMNQPLHAFDYDRLRENRIVVKRAADGERFTTLDGETRTLSRENLMICDGERAVGLAGVMGGLNSEIFEGTKNVLLESAFFDPVTIRRGAKRIGLSTEASYRFERGIDIGGTKTALKRALSLMAELAGGKIVTGCVDNYPKPFESPVIDFRVDKTNDFLGTSISRDAMAGYLKALEMSVEEIDEKSLQVRPPTFRVDISREVDLMEEVARLDGYDNVPVSYPIVKATDAAALPEWALGDQVRDVMVGFGFTEVITYSFTSPDAVEKLGVKGESPLRSFVEIMNPLTREQSVMRTSLVPGLLEMLRNNMLHDERNLKLYEWGKVFIHREGNPLPDERLSFAAVITGMFLPKTWYNQERRVDFYDMKGMAEGLLRAIGLKDAVFQRMPEAAGCYAKEACRIFCSDSAIGQVGRISQNVMAAYDLEGESVYLLELEIQSLLKHLAGKKIFHPIAKFPAVYRDISMIVNRGIESATMLEIMEKEGGDLLESVHIFDFYEGKGIDPSEKALAFRICYRSETETLDGERVNRLHEAVIEKVRQETGGRLREA